LFFILSDTVLRPSLLFARNPEGLLFRADEDEEGVGALDVEGSFVAAR
jgi:hypothetical protein